MAAGVVDADGHVLEPMSAWAGLPEQQRLRVTRDDLGLDHVGSAKFSTPRYAI